VLTLATAVLSLLLYCSWMLLKWAILIVSVTLVTAFTTPVDLAFFTTDGEAYNNRSGFIKYLNILIYALFGLDIVVSHNTVYSLN
jgi:hypothetical protein